MKVYCYPVNRDSSYLPLIFEGITERYRPVTREEGTLEDAIADLNRGERAIVHVHWEEFVVRDCETIGAAETAARVFVRQLEQIRARGGAIVWTIHNEVPHQVPYLRPFLAMRAALAASADVILAHNAASIGAVRAQVPLDASRVRTLPHASYLDVHETAESLARGLLEPFERRIQGFGWLRFQKGFGEMIDMLPAAFLKQRRAFVQISGAGEEADAVAASRSERDDVRWDVRHVPGVEIPQLLRSAACVVLPYERVLTSGVALLALSAGVPIVAVDIPQLRELLPAVAHRLLYARADANAFRAAIACVLDLDLDTRHAVIEAGLEVARALHPRIISNRLAAIYDELDGCSRIASTTSTL